MSTNDLAYIRCLLGLIYASCTVVCNRDAVERGLKHDSYEVLCRSNVVVPEIRIIVDLNRYLLITFASSNSF